jgi:hypothetical protein
MVTARKALSNVGDGLNIVAHESYGVAKKVTKTTVKSAKKAKIVVKYVANNVAHTTAPYVLGALDKENVQKNIQKWNVDAVNMMARPVSKATKPARKAIKKAASQANETLHVDDVIIPATKKACKKAKKASHKALVYTAHEMEETVFPAAKTAAKTATKAVIKGAVAGTDVIVKALSFDDDEEKPKEPPIARSNLAAYALASADVRKIIAEEALLNAAEVGDRAAPDYQYQLDIFRPKPVMSPPPQMQALIVSKRSSERALQEGRSNKRAKKSSRDSPGRVPRTIRATTSHYGDEMSEVSFDRSVRPRKNVGRPVEPSSPYSGADEDEWQTLRCETGLSEM